MKRWLLPGKGRVENPGSQVLNSLTEKKAAKGKDVRVMSDGEEIETSVEHSSNIAVVVVFEILEDANGTSDLWLIGMMASTVTETQQVDIGTHSLMRPRP